MEANLRAYLDGAVIDKVDFADEEIQAITVPFTEEKIREALKVRKRSFIPGLDGLPYSMYRNLAEYFILIFTDIFNEMWHMEEVRKSFIRR